MVSIFLRATVCHLAKEGKKGDIFERKGFTSKLKPCFFLKLFLWRRVLAVRWLFFHRKPGKKNSAPKRQIYRSLMTKNKGRRGVSLILCHHKICFVGRVSIIFIVFLAVNRFYSHFTVFMALFHSHYCIWPKMHTLFCLWIEWNNWFDSRVEILCVFQ